MAESFIFSIAEKVLCKLASLAYKEICLAWGVKADLEKLQEILSTIKAVLLDAEEQQIYSHELRDWLAKLKDACYDAEDVLDEFEFEALRRQVTSQQGIGRKVHRMLSISNNPLAFRFRMGHKIKAIRERFDEIAALKAKFNLTVRVDDRHVMHRGREMTHSFVLASDIIGRDEEKKEIIKLLIHSSDDETLSVIPIVGLGGLGKTALAKMVFNDERVQNHFELKTWICVSEDFDIKQLILRIYKSINCNENCSDFEIEQLQKVLRNTLVGKRYLLVMDNVWNEDYKIWDEFKTLLSGCASGSKILVTTRSKKVASIMGSKKDSNYGYKLEGLPYESCLSLFLKYALKEGQDKKHPNLLKIAEEIVKKCGGIPLAVKTLGSLLYSSTNELEWLHVRDNEIWKLEQKENDVLPTLKLSYDMLPSHLKQCFVYCSIFPKDFEFNSTSLIYYWMAHGLLHTPNKNDEIENIGMKYLKELWSRSFFQDFQEEIQFFNFKMHDLIHDLALSLCQDEFLLMNSNSEVPSKTVRHLSFIDVNPSTNILPGKGLLRTILFLTGEGEQSRLFLELCIARFQFLRVLNIRCSDIKVLPKDIGNLKHLRYLSLPSCPKIKKISNSICKLQSLQTLSLRGCKQLKELPSDLKYLINLRMLEVTTKEKCLPNNQIGCLYSLRKLLINGCDNLEYLMEDIGQLKLLQTLEICNCRSLIAFPRSIKQLISLEYLFISYCEKLNLNLEMEWKGEHNNQDLIAVRLKLRVLMIGGLPQLLELPRWLLQISTQTLQTLAILNCSNLSSLPEDSRHLTALKTLMIDGCPALAERCKQGIGEDWNKIAHIPYIELNHNVIKSSN